MEPLPSVEVVDDDRRTGGAVKREQPHVVVNDHFAADHRPDLIERERLVDQTSQKVGAIQDVAHPLRHLADGLVLDAEEQVVLVARRTLDAQDRHDIAHSLAFDQTT